MFDTHVCQKLSSLKKRSGKTNHLTLDEKVLLDNFIEDNRGLLKTLAKM